MLAFIITLALSGGVYAHAYTTSAETIGITEPTGNITSSSVAASQPDWDSILTPVTDTVILRPDAAGDETGIDTQYPASGAHWEKVDEETSDDDSTYVATDNATWEEDLYNTDDHSTQTAAGTINYVKVYMVCRATANTTETTAYVHIKTNGATYNGTEETLTTDYATFSYQWNTNPQTSSAWTWSEIDALQIGVGLRRPVVNEFARCTQVYAEVSFDAPSLTGNTPTGDLYIVYPNTDYTGDLAVYTYLTNTENLTRSYQDLNIRLYLEGSVEAGQTPNYRLLTMDNGVAAFFLNDGGSDNHTLSVTGGNYTLNSRDTSEWEAGWTVTPEFYLEVIQR
jgi:hypothetical protein